MSIENYKKILYRQEDGSWVDEIPAIPGCHALMSSREEALAELSKVLGIITWEYRDTSPSPCPPILQRSSVLGS